MGMEDADWTRARVEKGVIEETVELDDLGRIAKLSRKPDHWESLLGD
jgi:hypothetical protein